MVTDFCQGYDNKLATPFGVASATNESIALRRWNEHVSDPDGAAFKYISS